jgi:hypothetical protein
MPADVIGAAVMVGKIATDEIEDTRAEPGKEYAAVALQIWIGPMWTSPNSSKPIPKRLTLADCVAKVESCRATNFSRKHQTGSIVDSCILNRTTKVRLGV